ncbi:MAG: response regulator [Anaerolineae bacterium]|nr:response regulator [Anaerolineae bacterium]
MTNLQDLKNVANWRVLIVDDEPDNLNLASDLLKFNGATVMPTDTGAQLLVLVDEMQPNVIVLDLSMPVMDGWEVQRRLRARQEFVHVPIIALTALAMPEDADRAQAAGFDGYITKPFRVGSLLRDMMACVEEFIARHMPVQAPPGQKPGESIVHD